MRTLLLAGLVMGTLVGCAATPTQQCQDGVTLTCQRLFECNPCLAPGGGADAGCMPGQSKQLMNRFGASSGECVLNLTADTCANVTDDNGCNDTTQKYDATKAAACLKDLKAASCSTLNGMGLVSANCAGICKSSN